MESNADVFGKYRAITSKLRKRFLKKPNNSEGSEQFATIAKTLTEQECPQYSAFFHLAQARCENSLGNCAGEAQALLDAARNFFTAEMNNRELGCVTFEEHLTAAINCFSHAVRVLSENNQAPLAAMLSYEVGDVLMKCNKPSEAILHYEHAAELFSQSPLQCLKCLASVASCKVKTRDFDGALSVYTEMAYLSLEKGGSSLTERPLTPYLNILVQCEISRVLLLMLLQPTPQRIRPEHAQMLEKYAWQTGNEDNYLVQALGSDLFLLLQSIVMACQSKNLDALRNLQPQVWPLLSSEQNELLLLIIKEMANPTILV